MQVPRLLVRSSSSSSKSFFDLLVNKSFVLRRLVLSPERFPLLLAALLVEGTQLCWR